MDVESHFFVLDDGTIEQFMDTEVAADANLNANDFGVSIETEDDGNPEQRPWNDAQLSSLIKLIGWLCDTHQIPKEQITDPYGSGIGWHAMWGAPSEWTPSAGKTCPGGPRIEQMQLVVIPAVAQGIDGDSMTPDEFNQQIFWLRYSDGRNWADDVKQQTANGFAVVERLDGIAASLERMNRKLDDQVVTKGFVRRLLRALMAAVGRV